MTKCSIRSKKISAVIITIPGVTAPELFFNANFLQEILACCGGRQFAMFDTLGADQFIG